MCKISFFKKMPAKKNPQFVEKEIGGDKNGGKRKVRVNRLPRYLPTEEGRRRLHPRQKFFRQHKHKLRSSITPGTVLILVAGRHKGKVYKDLYIVF